MFRLKRTLTLDPTGLVCAEVEEDSDPLKTLDRLPSHLLCPAIGALEKCQVPFVQDLHTQPERSSSSSPFCTPAAHDVVKVFSSSQGGAPPSSSSARSSAGGACGSAKVCCEADTEAAVRYPSLSTAFTLDTSSVLNTTNLLSTSTLLATSSCPAHGVKAVCGKRSKMEDAFAVQPNFFDIPLSPTADDVQNKLPVRIAVQLEASDVSPTNSIPMSPTTGTASEGDASCGSCSCSSDSSNGDTLHFFGVYDGHGGCQAAEHCAKRLHQHLSEVLACACSNLSISDGTPMQHEPFAVQSHWAQCGSEASGTYLAKQLETECEELVMKHSVDSVHTEDCSPYTQVDGELAMFDNDSSGSGSDRSDNFSISTVLEEALKEAFLKTDTEFGTDGCASMVGTTALVALVGSRRIWLANCGDSRAVLCRGGRAIQLTDDHKPEREDEAERVEKAGGQVLFWNGHRVMGVLAMSRAIGDHGLRPFIIPEPEVSVISRMEDDDFLLLASDGLWDVMPNQEATTLTSRCIKRARDRGASRAAAMRIAASVITKSAIDRGSKDNVTVVIVDLKAPGAPEAAAAQSEQGDAPCVVPSAACAQAVVTAVLDAEPALVAQAPSPFTYNLPEAAGTAVTSAC